VEKVRGSGILEEKGAGISEFSRPEMKKIYKGISLVSTDYL